MLSYRDVVPFSAKSLFHLELPGGCTGNNMRHVRKQAWSSWYNDVMLNHTRLRTSCPLFLHRPNDGPQSAGITRVCVNESVY